MLGGVVVDFSVGLDCFCCGRLVVNRCLIADSKLGWA